MNGTPALQVLECRLSLILPLLTQSPLISTYNPRHLRDESSTDKLGY
jgi:hypothetical protein